MIKNENKEILESPKTTTSKKRWTKGEIEILKTNCTDMVFEDICSLLPYRTPTAIRGYMTKNGLECKVEEDIVCLSSVKDEAIEPNCEDVIKPTSFNILNDNKLNLEEETKIMSNFRIDSELIKSVRGNSGMMYSARIPAGSRTGLEGGVPNGTFVSIGALETGEREIRVASAPKVAELPYVVIRGEVNYAQDYKTDGLWGKFRNNVNNPLPVAKLSVGDFIALSDSYFATVDVSGLAVGQKFCLATNLIAGTQLVKTATPTAGNVVFEVVELKDNHIPTYIMSNGTLTKPYKMVAVEVKIA